MLDNHPRHQLRFIIDNYGRSIIDDPRRCRGMLKDLAPKHQRETNLLMLALDQKLVAELTQKTHTPILMHLDILAQRLHNNVGIQKDFAVWAIESWALALDVISQPSAQKIEPEKITITQQKIGKFIVEDSVATDTETGLMWLRFAHGQRWGNRTVAGKAQKTTWNDAMEIPAKFNQKSYAGYNDWRVPNIDELKTLIDVVEDIGENYIAKVFPKNEIGFWSSSPLATGRYGACGGYFNAGFSYGNHRSYNYNVRLVRG